MAGVLIPPVIGPAIIHSPSVHSKGVRLLAYYLLQTAYAANSLCLDLVASNIKGATKKMTITAILFLGYCAGNISGPQFFKTAEAPRYATGFRAVMSTFALAVVTSLLLRVYLMWVNKKNVGKTGAADLTVMAAEDEDVGITDFETQTFVYKLQV